MSAVPRIRQAPRYRVDWQAVVLWWMFPSILLVGSFSVIWRLI